MVTDDQVSDPGFPTLSVVRLCSQSLRLSVRPFGRERRGRYPGGRFRERRRARGAGNQVGGGQLSLRLRWCSQLGRSRCRGGVARRNGWWWDKRNKKGRGQGPRTKFDGQKQVGVAGLLCYASAGWLVGLSNRRGLIE
jgi:hypothetical protein